MWFFILYNFDYLRFFFLSKILFVPYRNFFSYL